MLSEKDLRDVTAEVLRDNMPVLTAPPLDTVLFDKYVLSPRVENEWLTPYKTVLRRQLAGISSPQALEQWCRDSLRIDNDHNPQRLRQRPMSVYRERLTDELGRNIFFVAAARSLGFPARINEVDGRVEYYEGGSWQRAFAPAAEAETPLMATFHLRYKPVEHYDDPKYYIHFTLSRLHDGRAQLLTYPETATWQHDFARGIQLEWGDYLLTSGTRLASGKVKARIDPIRVQSDTWGGFTMREDDTEPQVIGQLNAEDLYFDEASQAEKSLLATTGRGYYVLGIVAPNQEPTNHALRDIGACRQELEQWGRKMVLLFGSEDEAARFNKGEFSNLPSTVVWGIDSGGKIFQEIREQMKLASSSQPVFLVCDTFNRVVFVSQGYTINLGEQLLKVIHKL